MQVVRRKARALIAPSVVVAVAVAAGGVGGTAAPTVASPDKTAYDAALDYYFNPVAPSVEDDGGRAGERSGAGRRGARVGESLREQFDRKYAAGFPPAAQRLQRHEALASRSGKRNPSSFKGGGDPDVQRAKLLTLLVEFDPQAGDDFSGYNRLATNDSEPDDCVTEPAGTLLGGPLHNQLPNPADVGTGRDNNTFWVPDFSNEHYAKLIFSTEGLTERVRRDLRGPDGKPGVDVRGSTVRNMYREMSKGRYELGGSVQGWLTVPHSEAWYGATPCGQPPQSDQGHPDNPAGANQLAADAADALAAQQPDFPWADYDLEDQADRDGDGNVQEPDGVVDHLVLVHAGADAADDGGAQGTYAIWSHASVVAPATGGHTIAGTDMKVLNYIVQAEDAGVGVIAHEYGHDLGLPDLYDPVTGGETSVQFWDLMSTGSHSGPLFQTLPAHMGAWSKYVLGWIDPEIVEEGEPYQDIRLGQASRPPARTADAIRVNLPDKRITLSTPHSGTGMWWSNNDQDWADVRLTRAFDVPTGGDVRFWWWNDYTIEELWDYGFLEASTDGGANWTQLEIRDEAGTVVSTNEDPNGNLVAYGNLRNGLTGDSGGWQHYYVSLTPYAGQNVTLRFRYATDAAFQERGWFVDDLSLTADGATVFADDVESGADGWTAEQGTFTGSKGAGWTIVDGEFEFENYYLAEWRNHDGFDRGLRYTYDSNYVVDGEWNVERVPYNTPGMLVWYRDFQYTFQDVLNHLTEPPSIGPKGLVMLVDSHYEPLRRRGAAAAADPSFLKNLPGRPQSANAAFGLRRTLPFRECVQVTPNTRDLACNWHGRQGAVSKFTDAVTWYPGMEYRPDLDPADPLFFRDVDASAVVPSYRNQIYTTRVVDARGRRVRELFGTPIGEHVLGTGNPADGNPVTGARDLRAGGYFRVRSTSDGNRVAVIRTKGARKAP